MRRYLFLNYFMFHFLLFFKCRAQDEANKVEFLKLCDVCTCSEIPDLDATHVVLNIQCSELDRIDNVADLDKIEWPENPNGLKISAAFGGLGISTLGKLPPNMLVESLIFSNNAIKTYWPDPLSDLPNLRKLSFTQNDLTTITPDLFTKITALEDLDLSYNKLTEFTALDFKDLQQLKKLNLQSNLLKKIPLYALQSMTALEDLDLSKNGIYDFILQRGEITLKSLKRLNLSGNRIRSVMKDSFPVNNTLEVLDLSNNIIEIIEEDAFLNCTNLRELNLGQNNITLAFALPPSLQIAILKMNTLYHWLQFPSGITYIDVSYNRLTHWYDEDETKFDHLEFLNVGGNQLKDVRIENKLPNLFNLDLSYNQITEIPKTLNTQTLPNLDELHLDGNPLENVYFKSILSLKSLHMSDLSKLRVVEEKAFSNVIGRSSVEMANECFSLTLSNCPALEEIKEGAFDGTSLCMLDISKNNLTHVSRNLLNWKSIQEGVNLQWNPWACNCEFQWVLDLLVPQMYQGNSRLLTELRCASPRAFEGLRLVHFYNWTESPLCEDGFSRSGVRGTYMLEPSTENNGEPKITSLTLILGGCIILSLFIMIGLIVYLVKTRKRYRVRQAALKRKRQSALDAKNSNGFQKEQYSALNKA